MSGFVVVIPARLASERLPRKPLLDISGRPMILRTYDQARKSRADEVIVATDAPEIETVCRDAGASVELTARHHASGTDRIAEVAARRGFSDRTIVVNVQGDEPLIPPVLIDQVAGLLETDTAAGMATLVTPLTDPAEFIDPHTVKVVADASGAALYFSRAPIPASRDGGVSADARRHIGLYAYRVGCLRELAAAAVAPAEQAEKLEQLRALWLGVRIAVADALAPPPRGVDTEADLALIRERAALERTDG